MPALSSVSTLIGKEGRLVKIIRKQFLIDKLGEMTERHDLELRLFLSFITALRIFFFLSFAHVSRRQGQEGGPHRLPCPPPRLLLLGSAFLRSVSLTTSAELIVVFHLGVATLPHIDRLQTIVYKHKII